MACFLSVCFNVAQAEICLLPTPKELQEKKGFFIVQQAGKDTFLVIADNATVKEKLAADYINQRLQSDWQLKPLPIKSARELTAGEQQANLILMGNAVNDEEFKSYYQALKQETSFLESQPSGQSYILNFFPNRKNPKTAVAALVGKESQGTLYAAVTFMQMITRNGDCHSAPFVVIRDYPDFQHRLGRYRFWDYSALPIKRETRNSLSVKKEQIDQALQMKINSIRAWGYCHSFPGEAERKRRLELHRYARMRGIGLFDGVGADFKLLNRTAYPDGGTYKCIGEGENDRTRGFCSANEELIKRKCALLKKYVEDTEPTSLYLHFLDVDYYYLTERLWNTRCAKCRKRWPNDTVEVGKAAAMASVLNLYCEAIFSSKFESGYDPQKDCQVVFVTAPYCNWKESDEAWEKEVKYYVNLSKQMKFTDNIFFCIREIGGRDDGKDWRVPQLARAFKTDGKGHKIFLYDMVGGRRLMRHSPMSHSDMHPWRTLPIMSQAYVGADFIFYAGCSHPTINAEYGWSRMPRGGKWFAPKQKMAWGAKRFNNLIYPTATPPEIFDKGNLFDKAHKTFFGAAAGQYLADGFRPVKTVFPCFSTLWLTYIHNVWTCQNPVELQHRWAKYFRAIIAANQRAIQGIEAAMQAPDLIPGKQLELKVVLKTCHKALYWARLSEKEALLYANWLANGSDAVTELREDLMAFTKTAPKDDKKFLAAVMKRLQEAEKGIEGARTQRQITDSNLAKLKETAPEIRKTILHELRVRPPEYKLAKDMVVLQEQIRVGIYGSGFKSLLSDKNLRLCARIQKLDESVLANFDAILYYSHKKLDSSELETIRKFVQAGGGVLIVGGAPYYMLQSVDLTPIADWLGARRYGNCQAGIGIKANNDSYFSQDMDDWLKSYRTPKGIACLVVPVTGVPLFSYQRKGRLAFLMANKLKGGRVIYCATSNLPQELLYKIILWIGHNKIMRLVDIRPIHEDPVWKQYHDALCANRNRRS